MGDRERAVGLRLRDAGVSKTKKRLLILAFAALISACTGSQTPSDTPKPTQAQTIVATDVPTPEPTVTVAPVAPSLTPEPTAASVLADTPTSDIALTGDYLGQTPPGSTPVIFAPGIVSTAGKNEHTLSFSPDGTEMFLTRDPDRVTMVMRRQENGEWTEPQTALNQSLCLFSQALV